MRYVIDMPEPKHCNECPCSDHEDPYYRCEVNGEDCPDVAYGTGKPDWCPLVPFEDAIAVWWYEHASKEPPVDDEVEEGRVELYRSEWQALAGLGFASGLTLAQMVARLTGEEVKRRKARHEQ